jgi:sugar-specific transcriptional regulator TrmB
MNKEDLTKIGLTKDQASVYMALLSGGTAPAGKISTKTGLKRGLVYKVLEQLLELNLIEKHEQEGKTTLFSPSHPSNLKKVIESNESEIQTAKNTFNTVSSELNSAFNLLSGKPNIQFFEGTKGMEEIMEDSLYAKGEILSYADAEAVEKHISNINKEYVKKRQKFGIKKRIIVPDSEFNRKFLKDYAKDVTDFKMVSHKDLPAFKTVMQIYDNKVSYLTLTEDFMIGIIIEDPNIYKMHKYLFEHLWNITEDLNL